MALPVVVPTLAQPIEDRSIDPSLYHVYRSVLFSDALRQGWLYPRWAATLNGGLGSPVFSFYSPLTYYAVHGLSSTGLSPSQAWRGLMAITAAVAALGAFRLTLKLGSLPGVALLSATAYLYAPAFMGELWQRGSPQVLVTSILPWTLLAILRLARAPSGRWIAITAFTIALLPLCHNLGAMLSLVTIVPFAAYLRMRFGTPVAKHLIPAAVLGLLLAAVHLGPFVLERGYVQLGRASDWEWAKPADQRLGVADLGFWPPLYDTGTPNTNKMPPAQVDLVQIMFVVACAVLCCIGWRRLERPARFLAVVSLATAVLVILLQLDLATPVWRIDALAVLQFRWRPLSLLAPAILLAVPACLASPHSRAGQRGMAMASLVILVLSAPRLYPELLPILRVVQHDASPQQITSLAFEYGAYDLSTGEFQPIWRQWAYTEEEMKWAGLTPIANLPEGARWLSDERTPRSRRTRFTSPVDFDASLHLLYFPGWQVTVDGVPAVPYPSEGGGYLTVPMPAGEHEIVATYGGTRVQHVSAGISVLAILGCVVLALAWRGNQGGNVEEPEAYAAPGWQVAVVIAALVAAKLLWIDPHTALFRHASTRDAIYGATQHVDAKFDNSIQLHGYRLDRRAFEPGDELTVTLYWSADGFPDKQYPGSFVHLLGGELNEERGDYLWGQSDFVYRPGRWEQGKLFADVHTLTADLAAPEGEYSLEIGWWWPESGKLFQAVIGDGPDAVTVSDMGFLLLGGVRVAP